jgi:hypothetical protein
MRTALISIAVTLGATAAVSAQAPPNDLIERLRNAGEPREKFPTGEGWKPLIGGFDLEGWRASEPERENSWTPAQLVGTGAQNPDRLQVLRYAHLRPEDYNGPVIANGPKGRTANLQSEEEFGDVELSLEFMVPRESNSGVYLMSRYEVQIRDSYGKSDFDDHDCGAIHGRVVNGEKIPGKKPALNASLQPGKWQSFHIRFRAPRFDEAGKKTDHARFVRIEHNGQVIHENVEVEGPTQSSVTGRELPKAPLMLQGDHGPVAFRAIYIRELMP